MNLVRTFIALDLENKHVKTSILEAQKDLLSLGIDAKPVEPENLHFTIKFLGEIDESRVKDIVGALSTIRFNPFTAIYRELGAFPSISHINVVWVGVDDEASKNMTSIWEKVDNNLEKAGFHSDRRFDPHLTILRVKTGRNIQELIKAIKRYNNTVFGEDTISKLKIKKSVLTPKGPIYTDIHIIG